MKKCVDQVWNEFDEDKNGVLDKKEAKAFVKLILRNVYGEGKYNLEKFTTWFNQLTDSSEL